QASLLTALLPGVWVSRKLNSRDQLVLVLDVLTGYGAGTSLLSEKIMRVDSVTPVGDTVSRTNRYHLKHVQSSAITLVYQHSLGSHWSAGGGVSYYFPHQALLREQV